MDFPNIYDLNSSEVDANGLGDSVLKKNGTVIATQKSGILPGTTVTHSNNEITSSTESTITGETKIMQNGKVTGYLQEGISGETNLYDNNHFKLGSADQNGNIKVVLSHNDPLSQANRLNFQQLKFYADN